MAPGKITKTAVEQMQPGDLLWDVVVRGFGARRQKAGIYYVLRYRLDGRQTFCSIGQHGSPWTPDMARDEALKLLGQVKSGINPVAERRQKRIAAEAEAKVKRLGPLIEQYLAKRQPGMKPRSFEETARHLRQHAESLHRRKLAEIDRATIAKRLGEIESASGPVARNRVRSSLSAFFAWAIREGHAEANPVAGTGKAEENGSRKRVLSDAELGEVWSALGEDHYADIVRLLVLTGQRRDEIGGLRWSEIASADGGPVIAFPPERVKNRREHTLPLAPAAYAIVKRQARRKGRDLIFGIGEGPFSGWSGAKEVIDARILANRRERDRKAKPMPAWTLHDLRRTAATVMHDRLGVLPHIVEAILNHVSGHRAGVAGVYNRAKYLVPMREALDAWAAHVAAVVGPQHAALLRLPLSANSQA